MKKWIAIVLAALMLLMSAACAETARGVSLTDALLYFTSGEGQTQMVDLSRLEIVLWAQNGAKEGDRLVHFEVRDGDACLLGGAAALSSGARIDFMLDGMTTKYALDLSYAGLNLDLGGALQAFIDSDGPVHLQLPAFTGIILPKLDVLGLLGGFVDGSEGGARTFTVPHTFITQMLQMAVSYLPMLGVSEIPGTFDIDSLRATITQWDQTNSGFAVRGTVSEEGPATVLNAGLYPVSGGQTAGESVLEMELSSAENDIRLILRLRQAGELLPMLDLAVVSDPANAALDLSVGVMNQLSMGVSLFTDEGLQAAALTVDMQGMELSAGLSYGPMDGQDVIIGTVQTPFGDLTASAGTSETSPGERDGEANLAISMPNADLSATGALHTGSVEADAQAAASRDAAISGAPRVYLATMNDEQRARLMSEAEGIASGLAAYLEANFSPVALDAEPAA